MAAIQCLPRPLCPNLTDYVSFVRNVVGIPDTLLPNPVLSTDIVIDSDSDEVIDSELQLVTSGGGFNWFVVTLAIALETVNEQIRCASPTMYVLAVYNLGADRLINFAQDVNGQTFFRDQRKLFGINAFSPGVVTSTSDEGTSSSYLNVEAMKNFTLADLQMLKTPFGRTYLGIAQSVGDLWGIS